MARQVEITGTAPISTLNWPSSRIRMRSGVSVPGGISAQGPNAHIDM